MNDNIDSKNNKYIKFINKDIESNSTNTEKNIKLKKRKNSDDNNRNVNRNRKYSNSTSSEDKKRIKKNIPIHKRENIKKYINSEIVYRKDELRLLKDTISNYNRKLHVFFDLIYRASKDGEQENKLRYLSEKSLETLTLFHTHEGARFGVYLKREKSHIFLKDNFFKEVPGACFIVGLNNLIIYQIDENKTSNNYFRDVLCFGRTYLKNKNGSNWVIYTPPNNFLNKKCIIGNGETLFSDFELEEIVGDEEYHLKEVEIFHISIEKSVQKK